MVLLFCILLLMIFCCFGIILSKNPIYSVISFIFIIICFSLILIVFLHQELLGLILIIVYAGAIAVVFLFVIMMLNIRLIEITSVLKGYLLLTFLFIFFLFLEIIFCFGFSISIVTVDNALTNNASPFIFNYVDSDLTYYIGYLLYNYFTLWIVLITLILLLAMVGSIVLTFKGNVFSRQQTISLQITQKHWLTVKSKCIY